MPYATVEDFILEFGNQEAIELSHLDDPEQVGLDRAVLQRALDNATAEIDGYLGGAGYTLPLTSTPVLLRLKCCAIARYHLDRVRDREQVRLRYEDALNWFRDLVAGKVDLGLDGSGQAIADSPTDLASWYTSDRVFTMSNLRDW